ncbi:multicopper oxidase [Aspergillus terreus]|uniref:Multicopper oxidase n=1 Tax=Aspergillus terreus TaxID=33178 RepID=A0A5M3Z6X1_ASPTE|nr:hypothetical protein ATETN484_0010002700 [Aspergillus terreus]GFF18077.1 multicopper oxidase [Aspergillus terreus]
MAKTNTKEPLQLRVSIVAESETDLIKCDYTHLTGYTYHNDPENRGLWLKHKSNSSLDYNISTNYEERWPTGITRKYHITIQEGKVNLDGVDFPYAKMVNGSWPGPWIQVKVTNNLDYNGTAIHMHGIRILHSNLNDGVPGVTQCPVPPGESFTYNFTATHAIDPILMGDHNHRSAFMDYYQEQFADAKKFRFPPKMTSIVVNGKGSYAGSYPERRYTKHVNPGERKILRLINISTDSTIIFSIDEHEFEVIGADLGEPYTTRNISIGIGQRYHIVLKTKEESQLLPDGVKSYWIRFQPADGCHNFETFPDARQGILCKNSSIALSKWLLPLEKHMDRRIEVNNWNIMDDPVWVNYNEPTVKHLDPPYPVNAVIYNFDQKTAYNRWQYMIIVGGSRNNSAPVKGGKLIPAAHPSEKPYCNISSLKLNYINPPRRDVVLLPKNGFVVIAFQLDNPGPWVLHCHIAWHVSTGLALQALEEKEKFKVRLENGTAKSQKDQLENTCKNWAVWQNNKTNHWDAHRFQDDSGI